jgi:hypothetical protein
MKINHKPLVLNTEGAGRGLLPEVKNILMAFGMIVINQLLFLTIILLLKRLFKLACNKFDCANSTIKVQNHARITVKYKFKQTLKIMFRQND